MPCQHLLDILACIPDPRRAEGKQYALRHILLFAILAIVSGADSYRTIQTFLKAHIKSLNTAFGIRWRRAPHYSSLSKIMSQLKVEDVEKAFREHAERLVASASPASPTKLVGIDGKLLKQSFDNFKESRAKQILSAFCPDTNLILAHIDIEDKTNEIPAAQKLMAELNLADRIVTLDAMHCQKKHSTWRLEPALI